MKSFDKKIALGAVIVIFLSVLAVPGYYYAKKKQPEVKQTITQTVQQIQDSTSPAQPTVVPQPEQQAVAQEIKKEPPKHAEPKKKTPTVVANNDGTKTATISEGDISSTELSKVANQGPSGSTPDQVVFSDETGQNAALIPALKTYLNGLRWGNEISSLHQITIRAAGDTGWEGQYAGSYKIDASGKIISSFGYIILNTSYHQTDPHFTDYMKLVLSHEYGHHYSLSHKWVDLNLAAGTRFPDSYYQVRPLSKDTTATDYSKGWENCEAEIVAEDYSYLYSGYGFHAMSNAYGFPSAGTKSWFDNLIAPTQQSNTQEATPSVTPVSDNPPSVDITSPSPGANLSGSVPFQVNANDDKAISKVDFYVNSSLIFEDVAAPYEATLNTSAYQNGSYTLKAVAYDQIQSTEISISVTFTNATVDTIKPEITISEPSNPFTWTNANPNLVIKVTAMDNVKVTHIKILINDLEQLDVPRSAINATWEYGSAPAGTYVVKAQAFDAAGNMSEATITVNKT